MNCNIILEREDWFITDREPKIYLWCEKKEVKKSVFGMPSAEDYYSAKYHFQCFTPDFLEPRTWGCRNYDASCKNTKHNLAALGRLVPKQWPEQNKKYVVNEIPA